MKTRVFVFGLDAGSPLLIQRWLEDLPNLRKLINEGTWGNLRSTIPPFTSPAWACMYTGKNPAKVGIFGLRHRQEGSYKFRAPTSDFRRAPAVWEIAGQAGKKVFVVNVPDTYPPSPLNGRMVSGRPAPVDAGAPITYPADWRTELDQLTGGYQVGPSAGFDDNSQPDEYPAWVEVLKRQQTVLEHIMEQDWDLIYYVSMAIDGISHHFWKFLDPDHPDYDAGAASQYGDTIRQIYMLEDQRIGRIMERLTPDDLLLVVSDHGSAPCYRHIAVNRWLIDQGYLVLKEEKPSRQQGVLGPLSQTVFNLYRNSEWIRRLSKPFRRTFLRDVVVHSHFAQRSKGRLPLDALPIDWARTTAYYLGDDRLYLNVAGREPEGIVQPDSYEKIRADMIRLLSQAIDPESGKPLFEKIYTREEIYSGSFLDEAPDMILVPGDVHWNLGGAVGRNLVDHPVVGGKHHPQGVYLAWGTGIQQEEQMNASIYDVTPTILHTLDIPIPEDGDGHPQLSWFASHSPIAQRTVKTTFYPDVNFTDYQWTASEEKQVEDRLRGLGYLE